MSESAPTSESTVESDLLPTNFVGTTMAGVQNEDGKFRIYFQNKDYQIYQMSLNDPRSRAYTLLKLTTTIVPPARINTPIAAVAWKNLQEIRVYYITAASQVQEIVYSQRSGWKKGEMLGTAVENCACLYAQGRFTTNEVFLRVGFQSAIDSQTITEAYTLRDGWKTRVF
ncbi:uncharacterized protein EDB91DRAFT_1060953 [Suillus paluster]|uniref:uncharacterized protein n=1 Tax=Suillus paluster TaxID=48578 RepID=UPI001B87FAA1|nr:uncharacterized protein EDB91DRAFT_1060953 [Suillus paluster]KAG1727778.1 hypothetical protein EDB91DRAFT_1060953 [Suillus paluster]